ncbi:MAG TPA: hypothetical protein VD689_00505 [Nitrosopumilaceae archaeon]|nr:hypothetical protein [Nitrosopumilaceae archaeon]
MADSETFGVENGYGEKVVEWLNDEAKKRGKKFEARLYDYEVTTQNFGSFEMFSWIGDVNAARELIVRASSRFKIKVIEGSYKPKEKIFKTKKSDYAMVRRGDKVIGHLEFEAPMLGSSKWKLKAEERR